MRNAIRRLLSAEWVKFALVVVAATAIHWLGGTSERMLESTLHHGLEWNLHDPLVLLLSTGLLITLWRLWVYSRRHSGVVVHYSGGARFCSTLVLFLSRPHASDLPPEEVARFAGALAELKLDLRSLDWCPALLLASPWRMPLQAIAHHANLGGKMGRQFERVYVIASHQTLAYAPLFQTLTEDGLRLNNVVRISPEAIDFEDFHEVSTAVNRVFEEIESGGERRFLMDITGGSKICSVVAAALSFEQGRRIEYVHGSAGYRVGEYDLAYLSADFLKPGG